MACLNKSRAYKQSETWLTPVMNHIHDAGKKFPLFRSFSMKRRLDTATGKFKVYNRALLESNKPFQRSVLLWPELFCHCQPFPTFVGCHPLMPAPSSFDYQFLLCRPLTPLPTMSSFTGLTLSQPQVHLLSTSPLPTLLAVAILSCRLQPHLLLPSSLSLALTNEPPQLGNKPGQNPKIPLSQLC